jgi:hypothetical protein
MAGSHDAEVAPVQRRYLGQLQSLGNGDHRGVGRTERKTGIGENEVGHPGVIRPGELNWQEVTIGQRSQEQRLDSCPGFTSQQIADSATTGAGTSICRPAACKELNKSTQA